MPILAAGVAPGQSIPRRPGSSDKHSRIEDAPRIQCPLGGLESQSERGRTLPVIARPVVPADSMVMSDGRPVSMQDVAGGSLDVITADT